MERYLTLINTNLQKKLYRPLRILRLRPYRHKKTERIKFEEHKSFSLKMKVK